MVDTTTALEALGEALRARGVDIVIHPDGSDYYAYGSAMLTLEGDAIEILIDRSITGGWFVTFHCVGEQIGDQVWVEREDVETLYHLVTTDPACGCERHARRQ